MFSGYAQKKVTTATEKVTGISDFPLLSFDFVTNKEIYVVTKSFFTTGNCKIPITSLDFLTGK